MSEPLAQNQHWGLVVWAYPDTYQSPQSRLSTAFLSPDGPKTRQNEQKMAFWTPKWCVHRLQRRGGTKKHCVDIPLVIWKTHRARGGLLWSLCVPVTLCYHAIYVLNMCVVVVQQPKRNPEEHSGHSEPKKIKIQIFRSSLENLNFSYSCRECYYLKYSCTHTTDLYSCTCTYRSVQLYLYLQL